jgi:hypothetical protein
MENSEAIGQGTLSTTDRNGNGAGRNEVSQVAGVAQSNRRGVAQMWVGVFLNALLAALQVWRSDVHLTQVVLVSAAGLGLVGAALVGLRRVQLGVWTVFVGSVLFLPLGLVAALGARKILTDWTREQSV